MNEKIEEKLYDLVKGTLLALLVSFLTTIRSCKSDVNDINKYNETIDSLKPVYAELDLIRKNENNLLVFDDSTFNLKTEKLKIMELNLRNGLIELINIKSKNESRQKLEIALQEDFNIYLREKDSLSHNNTDLSKINSNFTLQLDSIKLDILRAKKVNDSIGNVLNDLNKLCK